MSWRLPIAETGLLVVDVQEKLVAVIQEPSDWLARLEILVEGAHLLGLPIEFTEQVPSKLGKLCQRFRKLPEVGVRRWPRPTFRRRRQEENWGEEEFWWQVVRRISVFGKRCMTYG